MKRKTTLGMLLILSAFLTNAQVLINETFSSGTFPPSGWSISSNAANWSAVNSSNAGGQAPEARFSWEPAFNATTRLILPKLDLSDKNASTLIFSFKQMIDHYSSNYSVGVSYRIDGGDWVNAWSQTVSGNLSAHTKTITITDHEVLTSDDLEFSFFFSGNSFNVNYWYIDDLIVLMPAGLDLALTEVDIPKITNEAFYLSGQVLNMGVDEITSFDINYKINDSAVFTESFTDISISSLVAYDFTTGLSVDSDPGEYEIEVFLSNINGEAADDNSDNDTITALFQFAFDYTDKMPLFESFTSSTCPPCFTFNNNFFNNYTSENADEIILIKYQMSWPGAGDPYFNEDGGMRRTFYGVSGVPSLVLDGKFVPITLVSATDQATINNLIAGIKATPAFFEIEGKYSLEGSVITITGEIMPYASLDDVKLYVGVIEGTTYENTANNGETFFKHVMHKMLPDGNGAEISLTALDEYYFDYDFDMSSTNVEQLYDLKVVLFLQNSNTSEIYQSAYAVLTGAPEVTINIEDQAANVPVNTTIEVDFSQPVRNIDGANFTSQTAGERIVFETADGEPVDFSVSLDEDYIYFHIKPSEKLEGLTTYYLEILPVMGLSYELTDTVSISFTTEETSSILDLNNNISVYPNPAKEIIYIKLAEDNNAEHVVTLYNISGQMVVKNSFAKKESSIDISGLPNGLYLLNISNGKSIYTKKINKIE